MGFFRRRKRIFLLVNLAEALRPLSGAEIVIYEIIISDPGRNRVQHELTCDPLEFSGHSEC